jgi:hypothetical protein
MAGICKANSIGTPGEWRRWTEALCLAFPLTLVLGSAAIAHAEPPPDADPGSTSMTTEMPIPASSSDCTDDSCSDAQTPEDLWSFRLAVPLYLWWPDLQGSLGISGSSVDYSLSHRDVLELLGDGFDGIWMGFGEARYGRFGAQMDLVYMGVESASLSDVNLDPSVGRLDIDQDYDVVIFDPSLSYRLIDTDLRLGPLNQFRFGLLMGMRYLRLDAKGKVDDATVPPLLGKTVFDDTENYWEVLPLGAEMQLGISKSWQLRSRLMLGGWGWLDSKGGTDGKWEAVLAYSFNESWVMQAGVRWFDASFEGSDLDFELRNTWGPVAALMWEF